MQYHFKIYADGECIDEFDEELYDEMDMKQFCNYVLIQNTDGTKIFAWDEEGKRYGYKLVHGRLRWAGRIGK